MYSFPLRKSKKFEKLTGIKPNVGFDGPITTAALCRGATSFFIDVYKNTDLCKELVEKITNAIVEWKKYHESEMGIEAESSIGLSDDDSSHLSPRHYSEIALPHQLRWYESFPDLVAPLSPSEWNSMSGLERRLACNFDNCASCIDRNILLELRFPDVPYGEDMFFAKRLLLNNQKIFLKPV